MEAVSTLSLFSSVVGYVGPRVSVLRGAMECSRDYFCIALSVWQGLCRRDRSRDSWLVVVSDPVSMLIRDQRCSGNHEKEENKPDE